eukprot:jgi/Mesvir1/10140/Mv06768-RA.1
MQWQLGWHGNRRGIARGSARASSAAPAREVRDMFLYEKDPWMAFKGGPLQPKPPPTQPPPVPGMREQAVAYYNYVMEAAENKQAGSGAVPGGDPGGGDIVLSPRPPPGYYADGDWSVVSGKSASPAGRTVGKPTKAN